MKNDNIKKSSSLLIANTIMLIPLVNIAFYLLDNLSKLKLFIIIFTCILIFILFLSSFFSTLTTFINKEKAQNIFIKLSIIFNWSYLFLFFAFATVLLILN